MGLAQLTEAAGGSGRSPLSIAAEMVRLRLGPGRLGFSEYLDFSLFKNDLTPREKQAFCGWRVQGVFEQMLCDDHSLIFSQDKVSMYAVLQGYGLPIPGLKAVYGSQRPGKGIAQLSTPAELAGYLRGAAPAYLKPSFGSYGRGNALVVRVEGDSVHLGDGSVTPLLTFCESLKDRAGFGWVVQEPLEAHSQIAQRCGRKVSGVRIHTFLGKGGPRIVRVIWKINVGREDSDNFRHGASGNMLAAVNAESGAIERIITGVGLKQRLVDNHPVTGQRLKDFVLPFWPEVREAVLQAQLAFPGFLCPGWDVAITDDGPKILEVNAFGDLDLSQHAHRRGFLSDDVMLLLKERGLDRLMAGPAKATKRCASNGRLGRRKAHWSW